MLLYFLQFLQEHLVKQKIIKTVMHEEVTNYLIMNILKSLKFGKSWNKEGMHVVLFIDHQLMQTPEGVLISIQKHEQ